jgi:3D (Asp-Asp-Asp) domain-containing protein
LKKYIISICSILILLFSSQSGAFAASGTYKVKKGDSLYKISRTYKVSVQNLKTWNHLTTDRISINQVLKLELASQPAAKVSKPAAKTTAAVKPAGKVITVSASAYTLNCTKCSGITATGINLKKNPNAKVISVDPKVIPLGSKVYVEGYGYAVAGDKGSSIKGNKIDIFVPSKKDAINWGRKTVKVTILK